MHGARPRTNTHTEARASASWWSKTLAESFGWFMPPVSQAQRALMYAAASKKGGAGGVPQSVAKEFTAADKPGKLPEHVGKKKKSRANSRYANSRMTANG